MFVINSLGIFDIRCPWIVTDVVGDLTFFADGHVAENTYADMQGIVHDLFRFHAGGGDRLKDLEIRIRDVHGSGSAAQKSQGVFDDLFQNGFGVQRGGNVSPDLCQGRHFVGSPLGFFKQAGIFDRCGDLAGYREKQVAFAFRVKVWNFHTLNNDGSDGAAADQERGAQP